MTTSVQVSEKTIQLLDKLKKELGARSFDQVIRDLITDRKKIPRSMFGSNPKLRPFSHTEEAKSHEPVPNVPLARLKGVDRQRKALVQDDPGNTGRARTKIV